MNVKIWYKRNNPFKKILKNHQIILRLFCLGVPAEGAPLPVWEQSVVDFGLEFSSFPILVLPADFLCAQSEEK